MGLISAFSSQLEPRTTSTSSELNTASGGASGPPNVMVSVLSPPATASATPTSVCSAHNDSLVSGLQGFPGSV